VGIVLFLLIIYKYPVLRELAVEPGTEKLVHVEFGFGDKGLVEFDASLSLTVISQGFLP
jgi:hypothetical protein